MKILSKNDLIILNRQKAKEMCEDRADSRDQKKRESEMQEKSEHFKN